MFFSRVALVALWLQISLTTVVAEDIGGCSALPKLDASLGQHAMLQQSAKPSKGDVITIDTAVRPTESMMPPGLTGEASLQADVVPPTESMMPPGLTGEASLQAEVVPPTESMMPPGLTGESSFQADVVPPTNSMMPPGLEGEATNLQSGPTDPIDHLDPFELEEEPLEKGSKLIGLDGIEKDTLENAGILANAQPQIEEQQLLLTNPVPTDSVSSQTAENTLQNDVPLPVQPAIASVLPQMEGPEMLPSNTAQNTLQNDGLSPVQPAAQQEFLGAACDWQCYLNRYPDLLSVVGANNVAAAEQHWNAVGKSEGRDCTCAAGESLAVVDGAANEVESAAQFKASANVMDAVTICQPLSPEAQAQMEVEIKDYEASAKFQEKISEAAGKSPASAGHVAIMKYLREKVLKPGLSVLELGCGAGGMLRFIEDEYNIGWGGGYYAKAVPHGSLVGVELVPGWVQFAQEHFKNISIYQGDITEYSLPEPYATEKFDLVMLNDVMEHVEKTRYGCFFSQLDKVTSAGSLVYMHTPSPMAQLEEKKLLSEGSTQFNENVVPHHFVVTGMASVGFELLTFEHDMDTVCGGEAQNLPKQLQGAHCYYNGWPKYTHNVFRKVQDPAVMNMS